ncbi:MAG TPA: class I SAM-dependent methyltransferase [Ruminococcaceae bacterium]|nr:class I SAM-dependent methyltransferase [Oscillospiraceae bacterium]
MNKNKVIEFFDKHADSWDAEMIIFDDIVSRIFDEAEIDKDKDILDVACGTGVLIPYYLNRNVRSVTAVDISPKMTEIARSKFSQPNVEIICGDADEYDFGKKFDCIVIYNAIPHFTDVKKLINHLSEYLKDGGSITVCHGMSRDMINSHHKYVPSDVSDELPDIDAMAENFTSLKNIKKISDNRMYLVTGYKL